MKASKDDHPVVFHIDNMLTLENPGCYILPEFVGTFPIVFSRCDWI